MQVHSCMYRHCLMESISEPLMIVNTNGEIIDLNPSLLKFTGLTRKKLIGTDLCNYFTEPLKVKTIFKEVLEKGSVTDSTLSLHHQNGNFTNILFNGSVYKNDRGSVIGALIVARDITCRQQVENELRQKEENVKLLLNSTFEAIYGIDLNGNCTFCNPSCVKMLGYENFDQLIGQNMHNLIHHSLADGTPHSVENCTIYKAFKSGKGTHSDIEVFWRADNTSFPVEYWSYPIIIDGIVKGAVVTFLDITDLKIKENELMKAKRSAEESTRLKDAFLANMSHEIRTPMNAIIGFSNILYNRKLKKQEKEYVKTIKLAGENLLAIINDILDISKIEAGMMTFEERAFSLNELFESLKVMLIENAKRKNLELIFNCDKNVSFYLYGDPTRLTQIIINLAGNAIKFTQKGKVQVNAKVLKNISNSNKKDYVLLEFSVKDTGIGIQKSKLEHIFERFRQADSHITRVYGGTGLGLSIAKQLVELQGGTMSVKSECNVGSTFLFRIPYKKSGDVFIVPENKNKTYKIEELRKLDILFIEDSYLNVELIKSLFSEHNLKLNVAENGSVGIEKIKKNDFDIILMDMEMPVMSGYEATALIRNELKKNIPIIAMTAHAMTGERERCLSLGMNDYISKPIDANLLFEKIYNLTVNAQCNDIKQN